jgi:hypothetical protein
MNFNDIINSNYVIDKKICKDDKLQECGFNADIKQKKEKELGKEKVKEKELGKEKEKELGKEKEQDKSKDTIKKPSSIQMKIPLSTTILSNIKNIPFDNPEDKVNIVIKSCKNITSKQALLIIPITKYFSNRNMLNKIITILKGESISLRLIDWFVTNYCKKFNILYNINDFKGEQNDKTQEELQSFDNFIIVHNNYKGQLKAYSKRNFDPFCRRNRIRFYYEDNKYFITTVGQLNFFKWALENHIIEYINKHIKAIDSDMNLRCEIVKKPGTKINPCNQQNNQNTQNTQNIQFDDTGLPLPIQMPPIISTKKKKPQDGIIAVETQIKTQIKPKLGGSTRKKRKEISTAASKSLSIHNFPTTLVFD